MIFLKRVPLSLIPKLLIGDQIKQINVFQLLNFAASKAIGRGISSIKRRANPISRKRSVLSNKREEQHVDVHNAISLTRDQGK